VKINVFAFCNSVFLVTFLCRMWKDVSLMVACIAERVNICLTVHIQGSVGGLRFETGGLIPVF
jgi:hypothetical protein